MTRLILYALGGLLLLASWSCSPEDTLLPEQPTEAPVSAGDPYGQPFTGMPATEDVVMYEVNLRAFSAGGDLQGVINRLDELKKLGVNVLWLMPIHPIGAVRSVNSPYSVKDHKAVGAEYGSLADLRQLTDEAHRRGMAVILDWVANHTAWDHPWIKNKGWYTQDAAGNIVHPPGTNWQDVADLNFGNAELRRAMIEALKFWIITANVDGYRFDYADGVPFDFWQAALDTLEQLPGRDLLFLAEGEREDHYRAGFDLIYGWSFYGALKAVFRGQPATHLYAVHREEYRDLPPGKYPLRFTTNHDESAWDQPPFVIFNGRDGALAASALAIFVGGVPLLYTGQEVGRATPLPFFSRAPIDWSAQPEMLQAYRSLLDVYKRSAAARSGAAVYFPHDEVFAMEKTRGSEHFLLLVNIRNKPIVYSLPAAVAGARWVDELTGTQHSLGTELTLAPYGYLLLKR